MCIFVLKYFPPVVAQKMCTRSPFFQTAFRNINTFIPVLINEWAKKTKKKMT